MKSVITLFLLIFSTTLISKVDPPNYNFSLDSLELFKPGSTLKAIEQKYKIGAIVKKTATTIIYKFYVSQIRYKFPVFVQIHQKKTLDFFARLPTYFLHDIFHQTIINRIGKQDKYFKQEKNAIYTWKNKSGLKHLYSATCTITCFPLYYAVMTLKTPETVTNYKPLFEQMMNITSEE